MAQILRRAVAAVGMVLAVPLVAWAVVTYQAGGGPVTGAVALWMNGGAATEVSTAAPMPVSASLAPHTFALIQQVTIVTTSAPLYTFGTPSSAVMVTNIGTAGYVYLETSGQDGGVCSPAVVGRGIALAPGAGFLFGPVVPLPKCAMTGISATGSNLISMAGY